MTDDHARGCQGREYTCTCGYDDQQDALIHELVAALVMVHDAIMRADPEVLTDTLWTPEDVLMGATVVDVLDGALAKAKAQGYERCQ